MSKFLSFLKTWQKMSKNFGEIWKKIVGRNVKTKKEDRYNFL